jgi:hypothetical protein
MDEARSDLTKALVRAGLRGNGAATPNLRTEEKAGSARQDAPGVARSGGFSGIGMSTTKGFRVIRVEPLLVVIDGGRK